MNGSPILTTFRLLPRIEMPEPYSLHRHPHRIGEHPGLCTGECRLGAREHPHALRTREGLEALADA